MKWFNCVIDTNQGSLNFDIQAKNEFEAEKKVKDLITIQEVEA
jgi:hypothetical protein